MIIKAVFWEPKNRLHERVIEVEDFHVEQRTRADFVEDPIGSYELIYHKLGGHHGMLRLGRKHVGADLSPHEGIDHLYIMENGKTVDHMTFTDQH
jgi:hypothetical protein